MLAIELNEDAPELIEAGLEAGILINVTQGNILRMLPPLTISDAEADEAVNTVVSLIQS
jgi:acetylornithine/N-succinyldiaminopimelate aminotransferase